MPNPVDDEELYNAITLGGHRSPGVVTLSSFKRAVKWDVKEGGGQDGASATRQGKLLAEGTASFYLVKDPTDGTDQFAEWEEYVRVLRETFDKTDAKALDVYHPDLAVLGITSMVVKDFGQLVHDGKGGANVSITLLEYAPPKKKKAGKAKGSSSVAAAVAAGVAGAGLGAAGAGADPNAAAKKELADLLKQAQAPP